jgi:putative inorganic carbon (HCO3(-)) transporter
MRAGSVFVPSLPQRRGGTLLTWPGLAIVGAAVGMALVPPPYGALGMLIGLAAGTILLRPELGLYLLVGVVPLHKTLGREVGSFTVAPTEGVIALVIAGYLLRAARQRALFGSVAPDEGASLAPARAPLPVLLPLLILYGALLISTTGARDLALSVKELLKWTEVLAVYVVATQVLTPGRLRWLLAAALAAAAAEALLGVAQFFLRIGPGHFLIAGVFMRAYGTFEQPNPYAGYLGLYLPLALLLALHGRRWLGAKLRPAVIGLALLLSFAMIATLSRGAWVGAAMAAGVLLLSTGRRGTLAVVALALAGLLAVAAGAAGVLPANLAERATSIVSSFVALRDIEDEEVNPTNFAVMERLANWQTGWRMFLANPLLGVGIGNYNAAYRDYALPGWETALGHAHNFYLNIAAEAGVIGLLAYVVFIGSALRLGARTIGLLGRAPEPGSDLPDGLPRPLARGIAVGLTAGLVAYATHNLFDSLFVSGMGALLALHLAALYTLCQYACAVSAAGPLARHLLRRRA